MFAHVGCIFIPHPAQERLSRKSLLLPCWCQRWGLNVLPELRPVLGFFCSY